MTHGLKLHGTRSPARAAARAAGLFFIASAGACRAPSSGKPGPAADTVGAEPSGGLPGGPAQLRAPGRTDERPPPDARTPPSPGPDCKLSLLRARFVEVNPHPSQTAYPEMWTYEVEPGSEPLTEAGGCLPGHVAIGVNGWQSISDLLRAKVGYDPARPREATLTLERVEASVLGFHASPGTLLATLVFEKGRVRELRFGPGMPSHTHARSLPVESR